MDYFGMGKSALDWKGKALFGAGIMPGKIVGVDPKTKEEIFEPLDRTKYKVVYSFIEQRSMYRYWLEYFQSWTWFANTFSEPILSKDGKTITSLVEQEPADCRFSQMNSKGEIEKVYLSKLWGAAKDQYVKFDPKKALRGIIENPQNITEVDNQFVKALDCIDMYDQVASLKAIADKLVQSKGLGGFKSAILPTNYPSPNKTYYQLPYWDGARLGGWIEIAAKIPALLKTLYKKAFRIKYHIEVPETYFARQYGNEHWKAMKPEEQKAKRVELLQQMDEFLTSDENAYNSFVSFFDVAPHDHAEHSRVKITAIEDKTNIDKELLASSAANIEFLMAAQVHPSIFSAGMTGNAYRSGGGSGSDIREAFLVYNALLNLERNVALEPLYLVRDYNREVGGMSEWEPDIVFRIRDTVLTTLDKGSGSKKVVS
jgi:hypothetical protein